MSGSCWLVYDEGKVGDLNHVGGSWQRREFRVSATPISEWTTPQVMGAYSKHVENLFYLNFMAKSGNFEEKAQARKELEICDRKMIFWRKHPSYSMVESTRIHAEWTKKWKA